MKIEIIPANRLTEGHIAAWSKLVRLDPALRHPMLRPEYTLAVDAARKGVEVAVFLLDNRFVGFFPFERNGQRIGRPVAWQMTDMHGIIIENGVPWSIDQFMQEAQLATWHFDHLIASQEQFRPYHHRLEDCSYMDLSDGYKMYRESRRKVSSLIGNVERKVRKLHREIGPLQFQMHTLESSVMESLISWKQLQLQKQTSYDVFQSSWMRPLMHNVIANRGESFAGQLSTLYAGSELLAVHLGLQSYDVLASWIPTFNPDYARYSPGVILHLELARHAAEAGVVRIELGRGDNPMKSALASGAYPVAIGSVDRPGIRRALNTSWYFARDFVHATPLRGAPLNVFRRIRNFLTNSG